MNLTLRLSRSRTRNIRCTDARFEWSGKLLIVEERLRLRMKSSFEQELLY